MAQGGHKLFNASLAKILEAWRRVLDWDGGIITPQAIWPVSRDWFLAVPFEQINSFFGGSTASVGELLSSSSLEAIDVTKVAGDEPFL